MWLRDPQDSTGATGFAVVQVACPMEARVASHALCTRGSVHDMAFTAGNANLTYSASVRIVGAGASVRHLKSCDGKNGGNRRWDAFRGRRREHDRHGRWAWVR